MVVTIGLLILYLMNPGVVLPITTQSIFGGFGIGLTISVAFLLVGTFLIIVPEPTTTILGIIIVAVTLFTGAYTFIQGINNAVSGLGTLLLYALVALIIYRLYQRYLK